MAPTKRVGQSKGERAAGGKRRKTDGETTVTCPECGLALRQSGLSNHWAKKHTGKYGKDFFKISFIITLLFIFTLLLLYLLFLVKVTRQRSIGEILKGNKPLSRKVLI